MNCRNVVITCVAATTAFDAKSFSPFSSSTPVARFPSMMIRLTPMPV
jgi:hypothetical protein